jgi:hypothetical protein
MAHELMKLKNMREGEVIVLVVRKHWFVLFREVLGIIILFLIPFIFFPFFITLVTQGAELPSVSPAIGFFFASFWTLILWNVLFARWTDYYYDVWIVTSQRVIDIEQRGLFHRDVATLFNLNLVQDVTTVLTGFFGNILGFGKLQVQTAATRDEFIMYDIANPVQVEHQIREAQRKYYPLPGHGNPPLPGH